jgi:hypothetical protein
MRAVEHTIRRELCTQHDAWVNRTENRCEVVGRGRCREQGNFMARSIVPRRVLRATPRVPLRKTQAKEHGRHAGPFKDERRTVCASGAITC